MADGLSAAQQKRLNPNVELRSDGSRIVTSNGDDVSSLPAALQEVRTGLGTSATIARLPNQFDSSLNKTIEETIDKSNIDPGAKPATQNSKTTVDPENTVRPNPLNNFQNYTYNIKLGIMTPAMLNEFNDGNYNSLNQNLILSSGGMSAGQRAPYFDVDFYINDLDIETRIGLDQVTGGANATVMSFTVSEPNGISFFNRLLACCAELKVPNYLDTPYFLNIQFLGYDDIEDQHDSKSYPIPFIIPIKITGIQNSVTAQGGEYNIQAVSFPDSALFSNEIALHDTFKNRAKTVGEFFDNLEEKYNKFYEDALKEAQQSNADLPMNENFYHTIKFEIPEEIRSSSLRYNKQVKTVENTPTVPKAFSAGTSIVGFNKKSPVLVDEYLLTFEQGKSIIDIINHVIIQKSDYIKKQKIDPAEIKNINKVNDPEERDRKLEEFAEKISSPLKWFRIRTKKKVKQYNSTFGAYARDNTIIIEPYEVSNKRVPSYPGWGETKPIKEYNYIFTGKNDVVLDFNIKFDALYYTALLGNPDKARDGTGDTDKTGEVKTQSDLTYAQSKDLRAYSIQNPQTTPIGFGVGNFQGVDGADFEEVADSILKQNLYANAFGDMISVDLEIIGDPEFLVGYNEKDFDDDEQGENVSLIRLAKEINCYINYKTPQDYDEETGMLLQSDDPAFFDSSISGIYKILSVRNSFNQGEFRQTLEAIRLESQPGTFTETPKNIESGDSSNNNITGAGGLDQLGTDNTLQAFRSGFGNSSGASQASLAGAATESGELINDPVSQITQAGARISIDNPTGFNPSANLVQSNGSSVFAGLAANNDAQPAQTNTQPGQTTLTKAQARAIQTGSFKTGFNQ